MAMLPTPKTAQRYGVSTRTIERWRADPKLGFPDPIEINGRHYDDEDKLQEWERQRAAGKAA